MKRLIRKGSFNKVANWLSIIFENDLSTEYSKQDNLEEINDEIKETYLQIGTLTLDTLEGATGINGEQRKWTTDEYGPGRYFGTYSKEEWEEFLKDVEANGIIDPLVLIMNTDGEIKILEGNHRVEAARQLNLNSVPAKLYYLGNSEQKYKIKLS